MNTRQCNVFVMDGKLALIIEELLVRNHYEVVTTQNFLTSTGLIPAFLIMDEDFLRYGDGDEILFLYSSDAKARFAVKILLSKTIMFVDGIRSGFEEVFQLPIYTNTFLEVLHKWERYILKFRYEFIAGPFMVNEFVFDDRARAIFYKEQLLDLTFTQYLILKTAVLRREWWTFAALASDTRTDYGYVKSTFREVDEMTEGAWSKLFLKSNGGYKCKYIPQPLTDEELEYFIKPRG